MKRKRNRLRNLKGKQKKKDEVSAQKLNLFYSIQMESKWVEYEGLIITILDNKIIGIANKEDKLEVKNDN